MTAEEYNHINDVIQDLYSAGKLNEEDFDLLCKCIDDSDAKDKYRWHDLRKDPCDLPKGESGEWYECVHEHHLFDPYYPSYQYDEIYEAFGEWEGSAYLGTERFKTIDEMGYDDIIAWRYKEPFEEGDTE